VAVVAIIGTQGIPAHYGGFEMLAQNLAKHLSKQHSLIVYCSSKAYDERMRSYLGARLEYIPLNANGPQSIIYDLWSMLRAIPKADILLILGVSGCIFLPIIKLFSKKKIIVNLDGIDWKRQKWKWFARSYLKMSERIAAKYADCLIADNAAIQDYVSDTYNKKSHLIEYGGDNALIDLPVNNNSDISIIALNKENNKSLPEMTDIKFNHYAFCVCRIEPENNIHMVLEAFVQTKALPLIIVGDWNRNKYGRSLRTKYGQLENIQLLDPIWDPAQLFSLRINAKLYIHGHSAGGTNPSLVEAMCIGLPVFAFDVAFNRATTLDEANYFSSKDDLAAKLNELDDLELSRLADRMKNIGAEKYSWQAISEKYSQLFDANMIRNERLGDKDISSKTIYTANKDDDNNLRTPADFR